MSNQIFDSITAKILNQLEAGVLPWKRSWTTGNGPEFGFPHNAVTGRPYRGINVFLLMMEQEDKGYTSTGWITPKAAIEAGLNFKGQKTTPIVFWKKLNRVEVNDDGETEENSFMMAKLYRVLNLDQCEGDKSNLKGNQVLVDVDLSDVDSLAASISQGLDITINHGGDKAFYRPSTDQIVMPPKDSFNNEDCYRATLLHEGIHSTGHKSRCNRDLKGRFGSDAYAFEELIAELGSCYMQAMLGINMDIPDHASYIKTWVKVLENDNRAIITAASKAQQAVDYMLDKLEIVEAPEYMQKAA